MADYARTRRILLIVGLCIAGFLSGLLLLPLLLPFLIGALLALCVQKPVQTLQARSGLPLWVCSGLCITVLLAVLGALLWLLLRRLCYELGAFAAELPDLLSSFSEQAESILAYLQTLARRAPDGLGTALQDWIAQLFAGSSGLATRLTDWLISATGKLLSSLPDVLLFALTMVISSFMISAELPQLRAASKKWLSASWQKKVKAVAQRLTSALGGWFKAQLILMLITFGIVTLGLFFLQIEFALLFGALIALIDALPLLGAGAVLVPWGLILFLKGQSRTGVGLILLYGICALTRSALEPKLIGHQLGLNPLLTLFSIYAGYRLLGVLGMIVFPIAAILIVQILSLTIPRRES